ncbi:hypothetical protein SDC9_178507 [bioreactor metagenome]|uniref:Uncharacterized protein n=1 Tax=bioreactor metagenome TaxID=1076179 RepID=A0A645GXR2_9ZZZZ
MGLKNKFGKFGVGVSTLIVSSIFASTLAFASPVSTSYTTPLSTPYGTMTGQVSVDCDNGVWNANTYCTGTAPTIYVKGECQNRSTGKVISTNSKTQYNTSNVFISGGTSPSFSVTVFSTHEVRGQDSYTRYTSVSQTL